MNDIDAINLALLVFRCGVGAVMLAHGINHVWRGKIEGTAGWFGSMGMKPPLFQAWLASLAEILHLDGFTVSDWGLREGVILEALGLTHAGSGGLPI